MPQQNPFRRRDLPGPDDRGKGGSSLVVLALIILALLSAIAYFYMTKKHAEREPADAVTKAAAAADNTAALVSDAARNAADRLSPHH